MSITPIHIFPVRQVLLIPAEEVKRSGKNIKWKIAFGFEKSFGVIYVKTIYCLYLYIFLKQDCMGPEKKFLRSDPLFAVIYFWPTVVAKFSVICKNLKWLAVDFFTNKIQDVLKTRSDGI